MPTYKNPGPRTFSTLGSGGRIIADDVLISSAELLAMFATPQTLIPAPGASLAIIFEGATIHKPAGTAYAGIAAGEDLTFKYTSQAGLEVGQCETTGFLDQTTAQTRYVRPHNAASGISSITPVVNDVLVIALLTGEITTGDSALSVRVFYSVVPASAFAA